MSSPPPSDGPAPPPPNFGQIPLPPGMTLEQFQSLQGSLVTLAITAAVAFGVMVWEYFNLLPDEVKLYQTSSKDLWRTPATWAFVILRYSGIIATLPSLFFTSAQSDHCQVAVVISQIGVILVVASSGIIFCYRVMAIWSGNKVVYLVVGVMYLGMIACWITVASQYRATNGPPTPFGSNCQMKPIADWAPICNASSVAFDLVILVLTMSKLNNSRARSPKVGYVLYRDSLVYFLFTAATNTTVLVIQALGPSFNLIKPAVLPFSTVITATMGVRVFLNLRLFNQRQANASSDHPSASTGSRSGNFMKSSPPHISSARGTPIPMHSMAIGSDTGFGKPETPFSSYSPAYSPRRTKTPDVESFLDHPIPRQ